MPILDAAAGAALIDELTQIVALAAQTILALGSKADVQTKPDGSPVTAADEAAEAVIRNGLALLRPGVPIISEEEASRHKPIIEAATSYFLVDPLDGTREFIAGRDEYTINIAIMTHGTPLLGIICAPARGIVWRGIVGRGAGRLSLEAKQDIVPIHTRRRSADDMVIALSRSHLEPRTEAYLENFPKARRVACGSSLKFCLLAEGSADLYPRLAPTHDWDIAAGHAILVAAGGHVASPGLSPLAYGSPELLIPGFIASGHIMA